MSAGIGHERRTRPASALRVLLANVVDYAGLFPPAGQDMAAAIESYDEHQRGPEAWMLGRFVLPAARLDELAQALRVRGPGPARWTLSVLVDAREAAAGLARVRRANEEWRAHLVIDSIEAKLGGGDAAAVAQLVRPVETAGPCMSFLEIPVTADPAVLLRTLRAAGVHAKLRTGGITADAFPRAAEIVRFIRDCAREHVAFKATAGLHHAWRSCYRLTYEPGAPSAWMFGFLNVLLAAALAHAGADERALLAALELRDASELRFDDTGMRWRQHTLSTDALREVRRALMLSFGSCSFEEPVQDLRALGLL